MLQQILDGRTDLIFEYLASGHDGSATDEQGRSLLSWCAYYGDVSAVRYLLAKGATLSALGPNFDLNGAAFHGHWQLVQFLLENGADPSGIIQPTGETPLHSCLSKANDPSTKHVVQLLLAYGADPNAKTIAHHETGAFMRDARTKGETPLHRAAAFGTEEVIQLLLNGGADRTIADCNGESPIGWASWHLRPGRILGLLQHGAYRIHPLHEERITSDHGQGPTGGRMSGLLGTVHLP